jgi:hypothetical protein
MTSPATPTEMAAPSSTPTVAVSAKRRWLRQAIGLLVVVAVVYGGFFAYALYERNTVLSRLEAKGEKVRFSEYTAALFVKNASQPSPAPIREAIEALKKQKGGRGELLPTSGTYSLAEKTNWRPMSHQKIDAELKAAAPALVAAHAAVKNPARHVLSEEEFRKEGSQLPALEHLPMISRLVSLLALERIDALAKGDARRAFDCVRTSFGVAESLADEPWLRSQQRRLDAFETSGLQLFRCLGDAAATEDEYRQFDAIFAAASANATAKEMLRVEFAKRFELLEDPRLFKEATTAYFGRLMRDDSFDRKLLHWKYAVLTSPLARPLVYLVQADVLRDFSTLLERSDKPQIGEWTETHRPPFDDVMLPLYMTRVDRVEDEMDYVVSFGRSATMCRWALHICQSFDAKGSLPKRLEDVCDAGMPTIDLAWFDGKAPQYTLAAKGFTLEAGARNPRSKSLSLVSESIRVQFADKRLGRPPASGAGKAN